jgi:alkaline phosphatase D
LNVGDFATIDRRRFLRMLGASTLVTAAGGHWSRSTWANPVFSAYPFSLGVEFVATSITSLGDGYDINDNFRAVLQKNPHMKFFNGQRGYVRHVVTPDRWQADYQVLDKVSVPDGRLSTRKSFIAENGRSALIDSAA